MVSVTSAIASIIAMKDKAPLSIPSIPSWLAIIFGFSVVWLSVKVFRRFVVGV